MVATGRHETTFTTPSDLEIEMTRLFDAPAQLVWDAWTKPEQLRQWWGPRGFVNSVCEIDLRPGGTYRIVQEDTEGNAHPFKGEYRDIAPPGLLVYTFVYDVEPFNLEEAVVTMTLEDRGGKTFLREVTRFPSREARDGMLQSGAEDGARQSYDRLAEHLQGAAGAGGSRPRLVLNRVFKAPRELVFRAWTDPQMLVRWWGPHGYTNTACESDPRPGGAFRISMRRPDGIDDPMTGTYTEFDPPSRLAILTHALVDQDGNPLLDVLYSALFVEDGDRTRVTLEAVVLKAQPTWDEALAGLTEAWAQTLERLDWILDADLSGQLEDRAIVQERVVDAPRDLVFRAWTEADRLGKWWGPNGFTTTTHEFDARPGGVWRFVMHGPDGTDYDNLITYREVVPPERLAFQHGTPDEPGQFATTVTFTDEGGITRVTMRAVFASNEDRDRVVRDVHAVEGGRQTLARLAEYVGR